MLAARPPPESLNDMNERGDAEDVRRREEPLIIRNPMSLQTICNTTKRVFFRVSPIESSGIRLVRARMDALGDSDC